MPPTNNEEDNPPPPRPAPQNAPLRQAGYFRRPRRRPTVLNEEPEPIRNLRLTYQNLMSQRAAEQGRNTETGGNQNTETGGNQNTETGGSQAQVGPPAPRPAHPRQIQLRPRNERNHAEYAAARAREEQQRRIAAMRESEQYRLQNERIQRVREMQAQALARLQNARNREGQGGQAVEPPAQVVAPSIPVSDIRQVQLEGQDLRSPQELDAARLRRIEERRQADRDREYVRQVLEARDREAQEAEQARLAEEARENENRRLFEEARRIALAHRQQISQISQVQAAEPQSRLSQDAVIDLESDEVRRVIESDPVLSEYVRAGEQFRAALEDLGRLGDQNSLQMEQEQVRRNLEEQTPRRERENDQATVPARNARTETQVAIEAERQRLAEERRQDQIEREHVLSLLQARESEQRRLLQEAWQIALAHREQASQIRQLQAAEPQNRVSDDELNRLRIEQVRRSLEEQTRRQAELTARNVRTETQVAMDAERQRLAEERRQDWIEREHVLSLLQARRREVEQGRENQQESRLARIIRESTSPNEESGQSRIPPPPDQSVYPLPPQLARPLARSAQPQQPVRTNRRAEEISARTGAPRLNEQERVRQRNEQVIRNQELQARQLARYERRSQNAREREGDLANGATQGAGAEMTERYRRAETQAATHRPGGGHTMDRLVELNRRVERDRIWQARQNRRQNRQDERAGREPAPAQPTAASRRNDVMNSRAQTAVQLYFATDHEEMLREHPPRYFRTPEYEERMRIMTLQVAEHMTRGREDNVARFERTLRESQVHEERLRAEEAIREENLRRQREMQHIIDEMNRLRRESVAVIARNEDLRDVTQTAMPIQFTSRDSHPPQDQRSKRLNQLIRLILQMGTNQQFRFRLRRHGILQTSIAFVPIRIQRRILLVHEQTPRQLQAHRRVSRENVEREMNMLLWNGHDCEAEQVKKVLRMKEKKGTREVDAGKRVRRLERAQHSRKRGKGAGWF